jgi:TctA family transporter
MPRFFSEAFASRTSNSGVSGGRKPAWLFAPPVAAVALTFESPDYFALVVLGMTGAVALARGSPIRSFIMILTGMLIGLVGMDVTSAQPRFTFGISQFMDGISIGVIAMGLFGIAELIANAGQLHTGTVNAGDITWRSLLPTRNDLRRSWPAIIRGTGLGCFFGILPGAGAVLASIIAYTVEKQVAADPGRFSPHSIMRWLLESALEKAKELVALGADVILPMGITQCPVHIKPDWLMQELGVPVVEGIGAPIRLAAMMVSLKLHYSRKFWPKSPLFEGK